MNNAAAAYSDIQKEAASLVHHLNMMSGIHIGIHDVDKTVLSLSSDRENDKQNLCKYCRDKCAAFASLCERDDTTHLAKVKANKKPLIYKCHLGLTEVILPIIEEDALLGVIFLGQVRIIPDPEMEFDTLFRTLCSNYPDTFSPQIREEVRKAYDNTAVMTSQNLRSFIALTGYAARGVYVNRLLNYRSVTTETSFRRYMKTLDFVHMPLAGVSIAAFAQRLNISYSQFNRIALSEYGMPLKQYILKLKMDAAAEMLLHDPQLTVHEIAAAIGIENQHYFSKLFLNRMGCSCTDYRRNKKNKT